MILAVFSSFLAVDFSHKISRLSFNFSLYLLTLSNGGSPK